MADTEVAETQEVTTVSTSSPEQVVKTTKKVAPNAPVMTEHPQHAFEKKKKIFRAYQIIWYVLVVIEVLLVFRLALQALGANPYTGFVSLVYLVSDPFALPFRGILTAGTSGTSVFDWSIIIAMIVYALIASGLVQIMQLVKPVTPHEVEQTVDNNS